MILRDKKLILSYNYYLHKEGGFCITLSPPPSKPKMEEVSDLTNEEINLLIKKKSEPVYLNKVPDYFELIDKYFSDRLNFDLCS